MFSDFPPYGDTKTYTKLDSKNKKKTKNKENSIL